MIDLKKEVDNALENIEGVFVCYQMPKKEATFPAISYYEAENAPRDFADDDEYSSHIAIYIDVWAEDIGEVTSLAIEVDRVMKSIGFVRAFAAEMADPSGKYRKTMRFEIIK